MILLWMPPFVVTNNCPLDMCGKAQAEVVTPLFIFVKRMVSDVARHKDASFRR